MNGRRTEKREREKAQFDPHWTYTTVAIVPKNTRGWVSENNRKKKENLITQRNETNRNSGNMIRTQNGVSWQMLWNLGATIQAFNIRSTTHTQFTQFKLHFTAIRDIVLFHFDSFCRCHKIVVIIFFWLSCVLNGCAPVCLLIPFHLFWFLVVYMCVMVSCPCLACFFFCDLSLGISSMNNKTNGTNKKKVTTIQWHYCWISRSKLFRMAKAIRKIEVN